MMETKKYYNMPRKILLNLVFAGGMMLNVIVQSSLMKFYTDVINFSPAAYGVIFLLFGIWNGINDPIIGFWADNRKYTKRGKYVRIIRWSMPIFAFSAIGLFYAQPEWSTAVTGVFLLLMLVIYEAAKTMLDVSFNAFKINTFLSMKERTEVQVIGSYVSQIPVFVGGMIPIWFLTGEFSQEFIVTIFSVCVAIAIGFVFIGSFFIKEDPRFYDNLADITDAKELFKLLKVLIKDKAFVLFCIAMFLVFASTGNYLNGYMYYMDNVLQVSGLKATIPDILTGIGQMLTLPLIVILTKKLGSRNTLSLWLLIAVFGHAVITFNVNYYIVSLMYIVILIGYGAMSALQQPIQGLLVDHIEIKTGIRKPAGIAGIIILLTAPAASVSPLILSILIDIAGYDGTVTAQTPAVENAIRIGTGIIPAIILLVGIFFISRIPIGKEEESNILRELKKKHHVAE